jgi:hypothetical protein
VPVVTAVEIAEPIKFEKKSLIIYKFLLYEIF